MAHKLGVDSIMGLSRASPTQTLCFTHILIFILLYERSNSHKLSVTRIWHIILLERVGNAVQEDFCIKLT